MRLTVFDRRTPVVSFEDCAPLPGVDKADLALGAWSSQAGAATMLCRPMKSSSSSFTAAGASSCIQWPTPSMRS